MNRSDPDVQLEPRHDLHMTLVGDGPSPMDFAQLCDSIGSNLSQSQLSSGVIIIEMSG